VAQGVCGKHYLTLTYVRRSLSWTGDWSDWSLAKSRNSESLDTNLNWVTHGVVQEGSAHRRREPSVIVP